jgi:hypothetical protein
MPPKPPKTPPPWRPTTSTKASGQTAAGQPAGGAERALARAARQIRLMRGRVRGGWTRPGRAVHRRLATVGARLTSVVGSIPTAVSNVICWGARVRARVGLGSCGQGASISMAGLRPVSIRRTLEVRQAREGVRPGTLVSRAAPGATHVLGVDKRLRQSEADILVDGSAGGGGQKVLDAQPGGTAGPARIHHRGNMPASRAARGAPCP